MSKSGTTRWREVSRSINEMIDSSSGDNEYTVMEKIRNEDIYQSKNSVDSSLNDKSAVSSNNYSSIETENISGEQDVFVDTHDKSSLKHELVTWVRTNNCTRSCITELLVILHKHGHNDKLLQDARILLQTPREVAVTEKCNGEYFYFGLEKGIGQCVLQNNFSCETIEFIANTDSLLIFKSRNVQFWPILCKFCKFDPFLVALYCGNSKPSSPNEFLYDF